MHLPFRFCSRLLSAILLCGTTSTPFAPAQESLPPLTTSRADSIERARTAAAALLPLYDRNTGLFSTTGWWNSANAITALADESRVANDLTVRWLFPDAFHRAPIRFPAFLNEFYDDEGWWALAWLDVYDLTPHTRQAKQYLRTSEVIFDDMTGGWDDTCGGGIWWKKDSHYKNAIANELFLSVAANLALHTHGKQRTRYLDWANREWSWFSHSGMINSEGLINDGLDSSCHNNGKNTWTYNQGVVLGGLVALSLAKRQPDLLITANQIATAALTHLIDPQGVLHDPCEPDCGEDGVQFKGIFNRNLAQLQAVTANPAFVHFLQTNATSLWVHARTPTNRFSTVWTGPPAEANAGAQISALDALVASAGVASSPSHP